MPTLIEWLTLPSAALVEMGADPQERVRRVGHFRPLSSRWAESLGMWGGVESSFAIRDRVGVSTSVYVTFKDRWCLFAKKQPLRSQSVVDVGVWDLIRVLNDESLAPIGTQAYRAWLYSGKEGLGLLPAEYVLRYQSFGRMLGAYELTRDQFVALSPREQEIMYAEQAQGSHTCGDRHMEDARSKR